MSHDPSYSTNLLQNELALSNHARFLKKHGMYSAALYYKDMNEPIERRAARVCRYALETQPLPEYLDGQTLFACTPYSIYAGIPGDDPHDYGFTVSVNGDLFFDETKFSRLREQCSNSVEHHIVDSIINDVRAAHTTPSRGRYDHGGIHNVPDYDYVLKHGIAGYRERILKKLTAAEDPGTRRFEEGLLDVLAGIEGYLQRYIRKPEETEKNFSGDKHNLQRLLAALKKVPLQPAESFYEAFVSCSAVMFLSNCYEPGRIDDYLYPYYEKDRNAGKTSAQEACSLIRGMLEDIEKKLSHPAVTHATIGGSHANGSAAYNALTEIVIRAIGGLRTPNVSLRVRPDMPQYIWDAFLFNISKGYAQPAIVNETLYLKHLTEDYAIPYEDAVNYVFGGCSELLIQGKTNCDSTWVAYNMLDVFEHTFYNHFLSCATFEDFFRRLKEDYLVTLHDMANQINLRQFAYAQHNSWPLATLFADGCIENAKSFINGGACYNFDSTNVYGGTNAINSLYTVKHFYDGAFGSLGKEEFLQCFAANYEGYEDIRSKCRKITKFGNDDNALNALAGELMDLVFSEIMKLECHRSNKNYTGRFMPAIIVWVDWITCGKRVGATPDGRVLGQATVDSCGPMQGTDLEGPTTVMRAALSLPQQKCISTCVLNLRLDAANFKTPENTAKVQMLFATYFQQGGCQLQINVVDPDTLQDAMVHPEDHRDLIVRVGGFSDNFVLLNEDIQKEVLKRTRHTI